MKVKKLLSTIAALAIAASSFAGLGITANAADLLTENFEGASNIFGVTAASESKSAIAAGASILPSGFSNYGNVLNVNNGTDITATFDSDANTEGAQPYAVAEGKGIEIGFDSFAAWSSAGENTEITLVNSEDVVIAAFTYSNVKCGPIAYTVGTTTNSQTNAYCNTQSGSSTSGKQANGWTTSNSKQLYVDNTAYQTRNTMSLDADGNVELKFTGGYQNLNVVYTGKIAEGAKLDVAKMKVVSYISATAASYAIDNMTVTEISAAVDYTVQHKCGEVVLATENLTAKPGTVPEFNTEDKTVDGVRYVYNEEATGEITETVAEDGSTVYVLQYDKTVGYTINYKLGDETVKTTTGDDVSGAIKTAENSFFVGENKYFITADTAPTFTVDADELNNVWEVEVRDAEVYAMKAVASTDENNVLATADVAEGEKFGYAYSKYLTDANGKVVASCNDSTYYKEVTPTESAVVEVPYTAYEGVAYFAENEDISNESALGSPNFSGGNSRRAETDGVTAFTIGETAYYSIEVAGSCRNTNSSSVFAVYKNSVADENKLFNGDVKGASQNTVQTQGIKISEESVLLTAGDVIILQGDSGNTWVDYILVTKTADASPVISSVEVVDTVVAPTDDTVTAVAGGTASYDELTAGKTVTTIYIKVDNAEAEVAPVVTFNEIDDPAQATVHTTVNSNGYFVYQIVADEAVTVKSVTYTGAADVVFAPVVEETPAESEGAEA